MGGSIKSFPECFSYNTKSSLKHTPPPTSGGPPAASAVPASCRPSCNPCNPPW